MLVAGRDQAVHPAVGGQRALADREHRAGRTVRHCSSTTMPPRSPTVEAAVAGELVAGPDTGGEDHQVGGEFANRRTAPCRSRRRPRPRRSPGRRRPCARSGPCPRWCGAAPRRRPSSTCTGISRGANSTMCVASPSPLQRARRLQAEQPAADHGTGACGSSRTPRWRAGPRWCGRRSSPSRPCRAPAARRGSEPVARTRVS